MARRTEKKSTQEWLYIVYDSNLNLPQMERCCSAVEMVGTSEIKNCKLLFRGMATVEPKGGTGAPVLLQKIEAFDEAASDRYKGWLYLYRKEMMDVELKRKSIPTMVYMMNDARFLGMPLESCYKVIKEGYQTAEFDTTVLGHTLERTKEMTEQGESQCH